MAFQFANQTAFLWFLVIPVIYFFYYRFNKQRNVFLKNFNIIGLKNYSYFNFQILLELLALIFIILSLARPQGNPERKTVSQTGRDVVFLLDLSKSMLAQDVRPNRLERSKELILGIIDELEGDRVALVVFAGNSVIKSPLTVDYYYFEKALRRVQVQDLVKGGTQIEQALRTVLDRVLLSTDSLYQDIILFTDGESKGDEPLEVAKLAAEKGISIYTVGIGSPQGVLLLDTKRQPLKFEGRDVISKLDEKTLKQISQITKGAYFPVHTKLADLGSFYKDFIKSKNKRQVEETETVLWQEYYQYFLIMAIICLNILALLELKKRTV